MLNELILYAFVATFIAIVVLGHVLLAAAIIQCARDDLIRGRQICGRYSARALRHYGLLLRRWLLAGWPYRAADATRR